MKTNDYLYVVLHVAMDDQHMSGKQHLTSASTQRCITSITHSHRLCLSSFEDSNLFVRATVAKDTTTIATAVFEDITFEKGEFF
jgi:hypothetical protein